MPLITLTTDFGPGEYVAQMKGVILSLVPGADIVDVSHVVDAGDVRGAAYVIEVSFPSFPTNCVHVVVVDPGVGTDRRALAVRFAGRFLIGPDNGCLTAFLDHAEAVHEITEESLFLPEVSPTFHGRDIFAPVAAFLAGGGELSAVGPEPNSDPVRCPDLWADGGTGIVLHVDHFGNLVTNFPAGALAEGVTLQGPGVVVERQARTFADAGDGEPFLYAGSGGRLEVGLNRERAVDVLGWPRGTAVQLGDG